MKLKTYGSRTALLPGDALLDLLALTGASLLEALSHGFHTTLGDVLVGLFLIEEVAEDAALVPLCRLLAGLFC